MSHINLQNNHPDVNHFAMITRNTRCVFKAVQRTATVCVLIFKSWMGWTFLSVGGAV